MKGIKKEVFTDCKWKILNLFYGYKGQPGKWYVRAENRNTSETVEFGITSAYLHKVTNHVAPYNFVE